MAQMHELALKDYISGMKYREIAEKYNVPMSTVKQWKYRYKWERDKPLRKPKNAVDNVDKNKNVYKESTVTEPDPELSDQEKLFCYHYVRTWNAMQAAILAGYTQNKPAAKVQGCVMKKRPHIKREIDRLAELFRQDIHVDIQDFLAFCMKVIGADIGDYLKFGAVDRLVYDDGGPVKDPDTGEYLKEAVNCITLGESEQLDTSVIQEIKQGKDGISIKLADKKWAWEQLIKYFDWLPDQWQRELEERKVAAAEKKAGDNDDDKPIEIIIKRKEKAP